MASFREICNLLLESFDDGDISEDTFLLLYNANTSKNPDFPYECSGKFDLNEMDDSECLAEFRFHKSDIPILLEALQLPQSFTCQQGTLISRFGRPVTEISMISNLVMDTIYQEHTGNQKITQWNNTLLHPALLETYACAIRQKGSPLPNCFGFIDGKVRPICRPEVNQRIVFNGHKRVHGLKYQSVALPNGMIANMYGTIGNCYNSE